MGLPFIDLATQQKRIQSQITERMQKVLAHGQYILGPEISELEKRLADFVGVKHCISLSSGTDALLISLMALGIGPCDEVITTPFTFMATGSMISFLGAKPVFVDVDRRTYNLDPKLIEKAITSKTKAIVPVSLYGQCADFDVINAIGEKHKIPVIEDAAQSFGALYKARRSCSLSKISCTSFFPAKPLGCYGDAGACFTSDDALAKLLLELRNHGQEQRYYHTRIGINGRCDTLQAAILLAKMDIFEDELKQRALIGQKFALKIKEVLGNKVTIPYIENHNVSAYAQFTIEVENRSLVQEKLSKLGIPTAVHYPVPLNLQPVYKDLGLKKGSFPNAEAASEKVMSLPFHPYLTEADQNLIVKALVETVS